MFIISISHKNKDDLAALGFLSCLVLEPTKGFDDDINNEDNGIVDNAYKPYIDNNNKSTDAIFLRLCSHTEFNSTNHEFWVSASRINRVMNRTVLAGSMVMEWFM